MTPIRTGRKHIANVARTEDSSWLLMLRVLTCLTMVAIAIVASGCTSGNAGGGTDRPISAPPGRGS